MNFIERTWAKRTITANDGKLSIRWTWHVGRDNEAELCRVPRLPPGFMLKRKTVTRLLSGWHCVMDFEEIDPSIVDFEDLPKPASPPSLYGLYDKIPVPKPPNKDPFYDKRKDQWRWE